MNGHAAMRPGPRLLIVPGLDNSGPDHWQTAWERERGDCHRVELGCWDDPIRNVWISRLDQAVHDARGEVVLIAHSLGCHAVAWWARLLGPSGLSRVRGALLVAPPDVDLPAVDYRLARFGPTPEVALPFPAFLVASRDDHYATFERSRAMARSWGALLLDAGALGHVNARSEIGSWPQGQALADLLTRGTSVRSELHGLARQLMTHAPAVETFVAALGTARPSSRHDEA